MRFPSSRRLQLAVDRQAAKPRPSMPYPTTMQVDRPSVFSSAVIAALLVSPCAIAAQSHPASLVNPLVGTTNGGNVFPGATMPFGMVQFSPEATPVNLKRMIAAPGGYEYRAK
jgi:hypothetical protein